MFTKRGKAGRLWVFLCVFLVICNCCSLTGSAKGQDTEVVRVGFFNFEGYHVIDEAGNKSGYGYEYLQRMARYTNWVYEYIGYEENWDTMQDMLENGEIDLLTSAQKTPEREEKFEFSDEPIGSSATILTVKAGNTKYTAENYDNYDQIRVGMIEGNSRNTSFDDFATRQGFSYQPVFYQSMEEMNEALQADEIDAIVSSNLRKINNEWIVAQFDESPFYVMVRKGDKQLLNEVNMAIEQLQLTQANLSQELFQKYYSAESGDDIFFTTKERAYIQEQQEKGVPLRAIMKPDRFPVSAYVNGQAQGIVAGIAQVIQDRTGLPIEIIEPKDKAEYEELLAGDTIDIVLDAAFDYNVAEKKGYKITEPYMQLPFVILSRNTNHEIETVAATIGEGITNNYIPYRYAAEDIACYSTLEESARAVYDGKQDITYMDMYTANYFVSQDVTNKYGIAMYADYSAAVSLGVSQSADIRLLHILNKTVLGLSDETVNRIINEETGYEMKRLSIIGYLYAYPVIIVGALFFICFLAVSFVIMLYRGRKKKAEDKKNREQAQLFSSICKSNDEVGEINLKAWERFSYSIKDNRVQVEKQAMYESGEIVDYERVLEEDRELVKRKCAKEFLQTLVDTQTDTYFECRVSDGGESYQWYAVTLQGMVVDEEHPGNIMFLKKNIDLSKKEEEEKKQALVDALALAQQASEAKGQFMSRMSHEIRTSLNAVIGYITIAKNNQDNEEKLIECISKAETAAKHLLGIINDVLDMSSIESGRMKIAKESFDFKKLITMITEMFYAQAKAKKIRFEVIIRELTQEYLIGDQMRLNQILMNLLSNAIKFTPEGGEVFLEVKQQAIREQRVFLQFIVRATGIGMSEEFQERIFQPFEQQDATIAQQFGGTGLGLSITRNLICMMGGTIEVVSKKQEGSRFIIELSFEQDMSHEETMEMDQKDFSSVHALIVDDEQNACEYMSILLERCGVRSESVLSGKEALAAIERAHEQNDKFDLCLMDWVMPDMDGVETVRQIRQYVGSDMPIIIVTAYDYSDIEETARNAGVDQLISKPLFQSTMFNLLVDNYGKYLPKQKEASKQYRFEGKTVLLVEDNDMNFEIAYDILTQAGFQIIGARNGAEAVQCFSEDTEGKIDVILMDIIMPVLNGYEAAKKIRSMENSKRAKTIPILAMTANAFHEDITRAIAAGMNNHIAKPIDVDNLFMTIGEVLYVEK